MFRTYIIKYSQLLITSQSMNRYEYKIGLPTDAILSFAYLGSDVIDQWDQALRTLLHIPKNAKYIIVDIGKETSPGLYQVSALIPDSEITRYTKVVTDRACRSNFNNT